MANRLGCISRIASTQSGKELTRHAWENNITKISYSHHLCIACGLMVTSLYIPSTHTHTHIGKELTQKRSKVARPLHTNMPHVKSHGNVSARSQLWLHKLGFLSTSPPYQLAKMELKGPSLQWDGGLKVRQCSHVEWGEPSIPRFFGNITCMSCLFFNPSFVVILLLISMQQDCYK